MFPSSGNIITSIGMRAFNNCTSLDLISIPLSVVYIYNYAFNNCTSLSNVNLGASS